MKRLILTLLLATLSVALSAQSYTLKGVVVDSLDRTAIDQATVRLLSLPDSALVKGAISVLDGAFELKQVKVGRYLLSVSYLGYDTQYRSIQIDSKGAPRSETIALSPTSYVLNEATIVGKAPEIVVKEDTVEYNADSYKTQPNAVVEDLLKKLPGVEVDSDGKITASGKEISKILIDGKEFFSDDTNVASKNLPVDIINKLQVVERKSEMARLTGVDDGEEEMVINITIKEGMKKGWFGDIQVGGGTEQRYENNLMINRFVGDNQVSILGAANNTNKMGFSNKGGKMYSGSMSRGMSGGQSGITTTQSGGANFNLESNKKFKLGGDVLYAGSQVDRWQRSNRQNIFQDSTSYANSEQSSFSQSHSLALNLRMRWHIDSLTTLNFTPKASFDKSVMEQENLSTNLAGNAERDSVNMGKSHSDGEGYGYNLSGALTLSRKSATKKGRQYSLSLNYGNNYSNEVGTNYNETRFFLADSTSTIDQETEDITASNSLRVRASYIEPLRNNYFVTVAYNYQLNNSRADRMAYDLNNDYAVDSLYSNRFRNLFETQTYNLALRSVKERYIYNIGVDVSPSSSQSENLIDTLRNVPRRTVVNLSPTMYYTYKFDKKENLRIDYRGKTKQPSISQLQPVQSVSNPLNIRVGNPDLDPTYSSTMRMRYTNYLPEQQRSVMVSLNGGYDLNSIVNQTTYNPVTGVQTTKPINVNGVWNVSAMGMYSTPFANKKLQFSTFTYSSYRNNVGFMRTQESEPARNNSATLHASESLNLSYRSDLFNLSIRGNYSYSLTRNSIQVKSNQEVHNYGGTAEGQLYLPWNFVLSSDISYRGSAGYAEGYDEEQWIWNAQLSTSIFKNKQGTIRLNVYDILRQRSNISRQITGNYIQDVEYNSLTSYAMLHFSYRFNTMGGKGKQGHHPMDRRGGQPLHRF